MQGGAEDGKRRRLEGSDAANQLDAEKIEWLWQPGSAMSDMIQRYNWVAHPLGRISTWHPQWQTAVNIMLASHFPMALWLTEALYLIYNDAYVPLLGSKHPRGLGQSGKEVWGDIWPVIQPMHANIWATAKSHQGDDQEMITDRYGYQEEVHFTFSLSPMRASDGKVIASYNVAQETTNRFIAERRLDSLRAVTAAAVRATSPDEVMRECCQALAANPRDFPFVLAYVPTGEGDKMKLVSTLRVSAGAPVLADDFAGPIGDRLREVALPVSLLVANEVPVPVTTAMILPISPATGSELSPTALSSRENAAVGVLIIGENPYKKADDSYYAFLKLFSSSVCGALSTAREYVRERRKAEQLAELDRLKTAFFHNVSHELRTPLTLMLGPLDDVLHSTLDSSQRQALDCALRNAKRLLRLVNVLLDFARIEAGRERATFRPVDVSTTITDLASNFRSACTKAGLQLLVDCPQLRENLYLDREMFEKVVLNLMSNAFKFTVRGAIKVSLKRVEDRAVLAVTDSGCGIPHLELAKIFDRFHRVANSTGRTHEGTGIGLALVAEIVRIHGGTVEVISEIGVGSTFTVSIPFGKAHLPPEQIVDESMTIDVDQSKSSPLEWWLEGSPTASPRSTSIAGSAPHPTTKNRATFGAKVLVVDDNADMRGYLTRILTENGYMVFVASDGMEALQKLKERAEGEQAVDLVLSDVMMPRMDGPGLLAAIRSSGAPIKDTPVVFLSARAGEEAVMGGVALGADDYLVKPFSVSELVTRVGARIELTRFRLSAAKREHELREQAERASAAKDHFIAVLSHELRTPLTPALMIAEAGENDESLPELVRKDMATVASNIRLEVHLIADLLDITKIRQGKLELHIQTRVDAHALLHQTMSLLKENIRQRGHKVDMMLNCDPCKITGDATRLQQIFWNVIGNSIKFTPKNGLIQVSTVHEGDELVLRVKDNGLGIDPPAISRLFSAFEQISTNVTRQFGGLGLGLAITKQLVLLHHGTIDAMSDGIGTGATFTLRFPLAKTEKALVKVSSSSSSDSEQHAAKKKKVLALAPPVRQLRLLVVEDNVSTQTVLARMLQRLGHQCQICGTVREAKATLESEEYDAMLCDLGLSDGSGLDVMATAKQLQPRMYSAALTGYGTDDDVDRTRAAGFALHLVKPIRLVQLQDFLAAASARCT